jgi:hypothetical protein
MIFGYVVSEWLVKTIDLLVEETSLSLTLNICSRTGPTSTSARLSMTHSYYKPGARIYVQAPVGTLRTDQARQQEA